MDFRTAIKWRLLLSCEAGAVVLCKKKYYDVMIDDFDDHASVSANLIKDKKELKEDYGDDVEIVELKEFDPKKPQNYVDDIIAKMNFDRACMEFTKYCIKLPYRISEKHSESEHYFRSNFKTAVKYNAFRIFLETRLFGFLKVVNKESGQSFWLAYQTNLSETNLLNTFVPNKLTEPYFQAAVDNEDYLVLSVDFAVDEKTLEKKRFISYATDLDYEDTQIGLVAALDYDWAVGIVSDWCVLRKRLFDALVI